jgi:intraflagellar transport protein 172
MRFSMLSNFSVQALCVGSFDRIRVYSWSGRKNLWEENATKEIKYIYR